MQAVTEDSAVSQTYNEHFQHVGTGNILKHNNSIFPDSFLSDRFSCCVRDIDRRFCPLDGTKVEHGFHWRMDTSNNGAGSVLVWLGHRARDANEKREFANALRF